MEPLVEVAEGDDLIDRLPRLSLGLSENNPLCYATLGGSRPGPRLASCRVRLGVSPGAPYGLASCPDEGEVHKNSLGHVFELHLAASVPEVSRSPNEG